MIPVEGCVLDETSFVFPLLGIGDVLVVREPGSTLSEVDGFGFLVTVAGRGAVVWKPVPSLIDFPDGLSPVKPVKVRAFCGVDQFRGQLPAVLMRGIEDHQGGPQLTMVLRLRDPIHLDGVLGMVLVLHNGDRDIRIHELDHLLDVVKKQEVAINKHHKVGDVVGGGDVRNQKAGEGKLRGEGLPVDLIDHLVAFEAMLTPVFPRSQVRQIEGGDDAGDATVPLGAMRGYLVGHVFPGVVSNEDVEHARSVGGML